MQTGDKVYKYRFTSTITDLLDAEEADTTRTTALRKSIRWPAASVTGALALGSLLTLGPKLSWRSFLPCLVFSYMTYYMAIRSCVRRRRIRRDNAACLEVTAEFRGDGIELTVEGRGTYRRAWAELIRFTEAARGLLLYFDDGTVGWLPNRIFNSDLEKEDFVGFVRSQEERLTDAGGTGQYRP